LIFAFFFSFFVKSRFIQFQIPASCPKAERPVPQQIQLDYGVIRLFFKRGKETPPPSGVIFFTCVWNWRCANSLAVFIMKNAPV